MSASRCLRRVSPVHSDEANSQRVNSGRLEFGSELATIDADWSMISKEEHKIMMIDYSLERGAAGSRVCLKLTLDPLKT
jgi:hypothetical protein